MMASCVSYLYRNNDSNPLIMPANLPLRDPSLAAEFDRLLPGNWGPVISEADSDGSRTDSIDETTRFGQVGGAAKRVARAVFLGSASSGALRGIDDRQIRLGVAQPNDRVASYDEALQQMSGELYYLYHSNERYYFHAEENLNKVANDRAGQFPDAEVDRHITSLLVTDVRRNNREVLVLSDTETAVPDDGHMVRLVILPPDKSINSRSRETNAARVEAERILLTNLNGGNRIRRNTLLFLAAKRDEITHLRQSVCGYLAWESIIRIRDGDDRRIAGLSGERLTQVNAGLRTADNAVRTALIAAYRWGLAPSQPDPQNAAQINFTELRINTTEQGEIVNAALATFSDQEALVDKITAGNLVRLLQERVWNNPAYGDYIAVDVLWELLTSYVYLPRLRNRSVLQRCIEEGVVAGTFGYAREYNSDTGEYRGLRYEVPLDDPGLGMVINENSGGLVVAPGQAAEEKRKALEREHQELQDAPDGPTSDGYTEHRTPNDPDGGPNTPVESARPRYMVASKKAHGDLSLDDFNNLRSDIIRNLRDGGGEVTVTITVEARKDDGFDERITNSVRENSVQLGLDFAQTP